MDQKIKDSLNPYFIGLPILMSEEYKAYLVEAMGLNPYFIGLPILIFRCRHNAKYHL